MDTANVAKMDGYLTIKNGRAYLHENRDGNYNLIMELSSFNLVNNGDLPQSIKKYIPALIVNERRVEKGNSISSNLVLCVKTESELPKSFIRLRGKILELEILQNENLY